MTTLRAGMLGSWELTRFETRDIATGAVRHPLGADPRGLILYTEDGYMSAQLAPGAEDTELGEYIAYTGPFQVDEQSAIVHHEVAMATMPDLLTTPQLREVGLDGDTLTLSATMTDAAGTTSRSTLTWRRANR
jgi:Lipocalin-like domain